MNAITDYYQECFEAHGDTAQGAGWPNVQDRQLRFDVSLDILNFIASGEPAEVLDLGCGSGELLGRMGERGMSFMSYLGVDALAAPLTHARAKFPSARFLQLDVDACGPEDIAALSCDVLVANGVFTVRRELSEDAMWDLMTRVLTRLWPVVRKGIVFNVMSPVVDWKRDDLFHASYDRMAVMLHGLAGRAIGFRADYGLYEYMAYALKDPSVSKGRSVTPALERAGDLP